MDGLGREVEIDLKIEASIPPKYVSDDRQRIALYRRMNIISDPDGVKDLRKEFPSVMDIAYKQHKRAR
jgi:transcription-repair coupling factor (superfamily II helicase)